jgi:hypothetical protein
MLPLAMLEWLGDSKKRRFADFSREIIRRFFNIYFGAISVKYYFENENVYYFTFIGTNWQIRHRICLNLFKFEQAQQNSIHLVGENFAWVGGGSNSLSCLPPQHKIRIKQQYKYTKLSTSTASHHSYLPFLSLSISALFCRSYTVPIYIFYRSTLGFCWYPHHWIPGWLQTWERHYFQIRAEQRCIHWEKEILNGAHSSTKLLGLPSE